MTTGDKARWTIIMGTATAAILYTMFALWAVFVNKYDEPQVYNMKFLERWDASYDYKGSRVLSYKGFWKEEKSGNVLTLSINDYMMYKMHIGEVVPMTFKPSRVGLQDPHDALYGFFPTVWLVVVTMVSIIIGGCFFFTWLLTFDEDENNS